MATIRNSMVEILSESEVVNYVREALKKVNKSVVSASVDGIGVVLYSEWGVAADDLEIRKALDSLAA